MEAIVVVSIGGPPMEVVVVSIGGATKHTLNSRIQIRSKLHTLQSAAAAGDTSIAARDSRIGLHVVRADEELMIEPHTLALLAARGSRRHAVA
jgi:acetate kinase